MDAFEEAHRELDRLQEIITRHEKHTFSLRGWMLTVSGGLLAAYYTGNIHLHLLVIQIALPCVAILFLVIEIRHINLIDAVVARAGIVEGLLRANRQHPKPNWYDGPRVHEVCKRGAQRVFPQFQMTFMLNMVFYIIVLLIAVVVALGLPPK